VNINDFIQEIKCDYKGENYSVRDNGAVLRHPKDGDKPRVTDNKWTFGKPSNKTGYMEIASVRVHRIVASAFHGEAPTSQHVVDHIDTNRRNNRPDNLRWITKLENILLNPITVKKIELSCGSIEEFLKDPSKLRQGSVDSKYEWMRMVSKEEAATSLRHMQEWAASDKVPTGAGSLGEWIFGRSGAGEVAATVSQEPTFDFSSLTGDDREMLLKISEPIVCSGGFLHSYFICPLYNDSIDDLECMYCKYRIEGNEIEHEGGTYREPLCFGKSGIQTYEELLSIVDVEKSDGKIVGITFNQNGEIVKKKFNKEIKTKYNTLFQLWKKKKGNVLIAHNTRSEWYVLLEEDPHISFERDEKVYARLSRDPNELENSAVRDIFSADSYVWEEVKKS